MLAEHLVMRCARNSSRKVALKSATTQAGEFVHEEIRKVRRGQTWGEIGGVGAILRPFGAGVMFTQIGALCLLCCVSH